MYFKSERVEIMDLQRKSAETRGTASSREGISYLVNIRAVTIACVCRRKPDAAIDSNRVPLRKFDIEESNGLCWKPVKGAAVAIIPARYASARLPGKPLLPLAGIPMIVHV